MKKIFLVVLAFIFTFGLNQISYAQKSLAEGKIVYEITYPDMELDNEYAAVLPTESFVYLKGNMSRTELSMGMGMSTVYIMNSKNNEIINLTDMMGTKTAVKISEAEVEKSKKDANTPEPKVELSDATKEIAGYQCKKATITIGDNSPFEVYYTNKISSKSSTTKDWKGIDGFPLEYSADQSGIRMKFTATSVNSEKVSDELFTIPSDYKLMTMEEMMKMMGAGQ